MSIKRTNSRGKAKKATLRKKSALSAGSTPSSAKRGTRSSGTTKQTVKKPATATKRRSRSTISSGRTLDALGLSLSSQGTAIKRSRAPKSEGRRTTVRVPVELDAQLADLANLLGTTLNDALVLAARTGLQEAERRQAKLALSRDLVARFEREIGPISTELLDEVDEAWPV